MPEWIYWVGWCFVPVAVIALSGWWHERENHAVLDKWLREEHEAYISLSKQNHLLRVELDRVDRERANLRYALSNEAES